MAHDVFISYSSKDKRVADAVCATLEVHKIRCWIAPRDILPGVPYGEALAGALDSCRILVLVFSSDANKSSQVMREVERAVSQGRPILPFRIEDTSPSKAMSYFLPSIHWLDALTPPLEKHVEGLAGTVRLLLEKLDEESKETPPIVASRKATTLPSPPLRSTNKTPGSQPPPPPRRSTSKMPGSQPPPPPPRSTSKTLGSQTSPPLPPQPSPPIGVVLNQTQPQENSRRSTPTLLVLLFVGLAVCMPCGIFIFVAASIHDTIVEADDNAIRDKALKDKALRDKALRDIMNMEKK